MAGPPDLQECKIKRLAREVIPRGAEEPFGAYVFRTDEPGAELGRYLERQVFLEAFGNTPELLAQEYGPYEKSSFFIVVIDHLRQLPVGVMRILMPSPAGLKSLNDIEPVWGVPAEELAERTGLDMDPDKTWDLATVAVAADYRGRATQGLVSIGLYQALAMLARRRGIRWLVGIADMPLFRIARWQFKIIFAGYKGVSPLPYLGSPASLPVWCDIDATAKKLFVEDPALYAILGEGTGLEPAMRPFDVASAERRVA